MSNTIILAAGTIIFVVTVWGTLVVGYAQFGRWDARDKAEEFARRRRVNEEARSDGRPEPARSAEEVSDSSPVLLEEPPAESAEQTPVAASIWRGPWTSVD